jgi:hypothetical protein
MQLFGDFDIPPFVEGNNGAELDRAGMLIEWIVKQQYVQYLTVIFGEVDKEDDPKKQMVELRTDRY